MLVAGVGVTLLTRPASIGDPARTLVSARRWTLVRRGLALYGAGLLFDKIWPGTILPYYGAMFVLAAVLFTLARPLGRRRRRGRRRSPAPAIAWWGLERRLDGHDTAWLVRRRGRDSPRGLRASTWRSTAPTRCCRGWRSSAPASCSGGCSATRLVAAGRHRRRADAVRAGDDDLRVARRRATAAWCWPAPTRSTAASLYTASALGTALVAFGAITWLAERFRTSAAIELLRHAGAMSLTLYVAHALVFNLVVDWLGWVRPTGLDTALTFAAVYWVVAIAAATWWHRRVGIGPAEWVYRRLGG